MALEDAQDGIRRPVARLSAGRDPNSKPASGPKYTGGDVIAGKYRLGRLLGEGGMGHVWLAHNETLDVDVALKLLRADAESGEAAERLLQEARAAARLGHPAIVRIFDFGRTDFGEPYIVMELLEGEDLATGLARRGRLSAIKAVRTVVPIAHALATAHAKGIVHRDLKPENIFLSKMDGDRLQPKLVDFGVAKLDRGKGGARLTQSGALLGSPAYMSPEQARGDDADNRADVWSLAVVLYEMMTGRLPYEGKNYNAILYAIVSSDPQPTTTLGSGDDELWRVLQRGLAKNPDQRFQSMRQFGEALAGWLGHQGVLEDIAGASLETTWRKPDRSGDGLGTVPPPPMVRPRPVDTTPLETPSVPETPPEQPRVWLIVAVCALLAGLVGSLTVMVVHGARSAPSSPPAESVLAPSVPVQTLPPVPTAAAPAPTATAEPASPTEGADKKPGASRKHAGHAGRADHAGNHAAVRTLKDPFR